MSDASSRAKGRRVVVWVADGEPIPHCDYGTRLIDRLRHAGFEPLAVQLDREKLDESLLSCTRHVVSGGATPVHAPEGWMPGALDRLGGVVERGLLGQASLVGVCLGSQMIAQVLLGRRLATRVHGSHIEVGLHPLEAVPAGGERPRLPAVGQFHFEEIVPELIDHPEVALLYENAHSRVQVYSAGRGVTGVQAHPEFDPDDLRQLVRHNRKTLRAYGCSADEALRTIDERQEAWSADAFEVLVARPLERPAG